MYSTIEKTKYGFTHLVAYPDECGIETLDGLNNWEYLDQGNRTLYFADTEEEAKKVLSSVS